jgi:dihydroorotase/N-acyl-D-amino-acid deacylase
VVILGGRIVDGSGNPWFYGDLAIGGDRIARIAPAGVLQEAPARERVDARGLVVAPGFIDIQSHSRDAFLTGDGRVLSKITQGITTEIMGEGWTNAPVNELTLAAAGSADPAEQELSREFMGPHGFDRWLRTLERNGTSPNFGSFLGATTVRMYAKGMTEGPATVEELETMRMLVRDAMEDGAFGLATALIYPPGSFASTEELIEISKAMAPYGGVYITHMRSEADQYLQAIDEALAIGRGAGVPVEIYHLKAGGQRNWHKASLAIARIDAARAEGQDVQANMYPYVAGGTGLTACLPPWASADGKLTLGLGRRQADGEPARLRHAGEDPRRSAQPQDGVGKPLRVGHGRGRPGAGSGEGGEPAAGRNAPVGDCLPHEEGLGGDGHGAD